MSNPAVVYLKKLTHSEIKNYNMREVNMTLGLKLAMSTN